TGTHMHDDLMTSLFSDWLDHHDCVVAVKGFANSIDRKAGKEVRWEIEPTCVEGDAVETRRQTVLPVANVQTEDGGFRLIESAPCGSVGGRIPHESRPLILERRLPDPGSPPEQDQRLGAGNRLEPFAQREQRAFDVRCVLASIGQRSTEGRIAVRGPGLMSLRQETANDLRDLRPIRREILQKPQSG